MTIPNKCEFCDKRGLPLLLVRDAIAPAGAGAPLAPSLPVELAPATAHYTKRLLRSGYVNVFDEARQRWETYFVTPDGYLFKLILTSSATPVIPLKPFNCPEEGHQALAGCITISDPVNATKVWIGFSDVLWTDSVRKLNNDPACRKRHMVEIDIKAALNGKPGIHQSISRVSEVVAEYAMSPGLIRKNFSWALFKFALRQGSAVRLIQECENLRPGQGLVVTLSDPAGLAQELASLMRRNSELFLENKPEDRQKLAASLAIDSIEDAVRMQAEHMDIAAAESIASQQEESNSIGHWLSSSTRARTEAVRNVSQAAIKSAAEQSWKKYETKFDNTARQAWYGPFKKKLEAFATVFVYPLAPSHVAYMESSELKEYFACNFDPFDPESGAVYTEVVTRCIAGTEDKRACAQLYEKWLTSEDIGVNNILLRALVLNQGVTAKAIEKVIKGSFDLRQIPWDSLFPIFAKVTERLGQSQNVLARLITELSGSLATIFGKIMDGSSGFRAAIIATGLISGHPIVVCNIVGSRGQFRAHLVRQLLRASGQSIPSGQMRRAVNAELKRLRIHGVPLEGTTTHRWVIVADEEMITRMPSGLSPQKRAEWLAGCLRTVEDLDRLNLERWRATIHTDVRSGAIAGILQAISLTKLYEDEAKSLSNNKSDAIGRIYAGIGTIAATTSESLGQALAGQGAPLRLGQGLAANSGTILKLLGRIGGLVFGLYVSILDINLASKEAKEGNKGMAMLYYISAGVGGILACAMLASSMSWITGALMFPLIAILVLVAIGIALIIENVKDNPIQDWLERCP